MWIAQPRPGQERRRQREHDRLAPGHAEVRRLLGCFPGIGRGLGWPGAVAERFGAYAGFEQSGARQQDPRPVAVPQHPQPPLCDKRRLRGSGGDREPVAVRQSHGDLAPVRFDSHWLDVHRHEDLREQWLDLPVDENRPDVQKQVAAEQVRHQHDVRGGEAVVGHEDRDDKPHQDDGGDQPARPTAQRRGENLPNSGSCPAGTVGSGVQVGMVIPPAGWRLWLGGVVARWCQWLSGSVAQWPIGWAAGSAGARSGAGRNRATPITG